MTLGRPQRILGELVTFKNSKAFHHDGILYQDTACTTTIVHVHGSFGNFYQNDFLRVMASTYRDAGINFLSFNLSGHDGLAEGYRNAWDFEYVGGAVTDFADCIIDIQAAIDFVAPFSTRIILQGHSMGCDRILHYLLTSGTHHDMILLSPCDSYQLQANWIAPESVDAQIARLNRTATENPELEWLSAREYGIRQGDWSYPIHITRKTLLSVMRGPNFELIRPTRPPTFHLDQRALIYIGGDDTLQTNPREVMLNYFRCCVRDVTTTAYYPEGDHSLWGCENEVSRDIAAWVAT